MINHSQFDENYIRKREKDLAAHSAQIGRLCTLWSGLELDIAYCLIAVSYLDDPINKNVLIGALNMREKSEALLAIAYKRKPTDKWFDRLSQVMKTIDSELRIERNRMIHDYWTFMPSDDGTEIIQRMQLKAKVRKEPGTGETKLHLANIKPVTPDNISTLCENIISANVTLSGLRREFELSPIRGRPARPAHFPHRGHH